MSNVVSFPTAGDDDLRWIATVTYRSEESPSGRSSTVWHIEELDELQDIVERGPDWNALLSVDVILNPKRASYVAHIEGERA